MRIVDMYCPDRCDTNYHVFYTSALVIITLGRLVETWVDRFDKLGRVGI
jgi:hypothetical protein